VVWNPQASLNRAEQSLLTRLQKQIDSTPMADRTYR